MKYKKGDIVKVKLKLEVGRYNMVSFTQTMTAFRGLEAKVTDVEESTVVKYFHLEFRNKIAERLQLESFNARFAFTDDMVEPYGFVKSNSII